MFIILDRRLRFVCIVLLFFFVFKQKTAYEMRISDWSSDVCSSDLPAFGQFVAGFGRPIGRLGQDAVKTIQCGAFGTPPEKLRSQIGRASCRERVCQYV